MTQSQALSTPLALVVRVCACAWLIALFAGPAHSGAAIAADTPGGPGSRADAFAQLGPLLPTPSEVRTASGARGPGYWQQRADYRIDVSLDDDAQRITGSERIVYHNNSPHTIRYLWIQLDQNRFRPDSADMRSAKAPDLEEFSYRAMNSLLTRTEFDGGFTLSRVQDARGAPIAHAVVDTMMRLDLTRPLAPGEQYEINIDWSHNIIDALAVRARGGYEYFAEDDNYIYEIAQWYPRMAVYSDFDGWQNKQFLGRGEFTLELGDFEVHITVPADHIVAATGALQNPEEVLSRAQRQRMREADGADAPVFIVTPQEAADNQSTHTDGTRTWVFRADNVRDFAFASSRKFIWDAWVADINGSPVTAMSFYPNEAEPLWSQYSTQAIVHTMEVYSQYTFDYPYPVSISVNGPVGGMEYPMITFNKPRPYPDGTYWDIRQDSKDHTWERSKLGLISVIIHEVGHNYFPMIVNSDERQWTWMDEGLNTFLQFLAEQAWSENYPSRRGEPKEIVEYMLSDNQVPIMTNSESLLQFGNNAYGKPATALNILRESILGRELFDFAFKEYARRWKFARPTPADFFRTMEDASGLDLDWFWRGWFYGTDHVDVAIEKVTLYQLDSGEPDRDKPAMRADDEIEPETVSQQRNRGADTRLQQHPTLADFYDSYDEFDVTPYDYAQYRKLLDSLDEREKKALQTDKVFQLVQFANIGGLVTPLPLRLTYQDGTTAQYVIPAQIWRWDSARAAHLFVSDQLIEKFELDPHLATADADTSNNTFPRQPTTTRFQLFKQAEEPNPMLRMDEEQWKDDGDN